MRRGHSTFKIHLHPAPPVKRLKPRRSDDSGFTRAQERNDGSGLFALGRLDAVRRGTIQEKKDDARGERRAADAVRDERQRPERLAACLQRGDGRLWVTAVRATLGARAKLL